MKQIVIISFLLSSALASAQSPKPVGKASTVLIPTKDNEPVIVRATDYIGKVLDTDLDNVHVYAQELLSPSIPKKERGIMIMVLSKRNTRRVNIQYDEIQPLLDAVNYFIKLDNTASPFLNLEASYKTHNALQLDLTLSVNGGKVTKDFTINAGEINPAGIYFPEASAMQTFVDLITKAKKRIDDLK